ncbi:MAG TPA: hypothetical protein VEC11_10700 [Allosphingosinicella sp.]|nr:hypothetical protein [Allosphingosinicella sp.]
MACDRAEDRTLLLSLGLFGVPAGRDQRDREPQAADEGDRAESDESGAR